MVLRRGVNDVAEHNLIHLFGVDAGTLDGRTSGGSTELGRGDVAQTPPEGPDRCAGG
jgi:hypothetical protein